MRRTAQGTDIIFHGGPAGEFSRGACLLGLAKPLEMGIFLHRSPVKYYGGGPFTVNSDS